MYNSAQDSVSPYGRDFANSFKKPDIPATYGHNISPSIRKLVTDRPNPFIPSMPGPRQPVIAPAPGLYRAVNPDISEPPAKQMMFEKPANNNISLTEAPEHVLRQHRDIYINMLPKDLDAKSGHQLSPIAQVPKSSRNIEPLDKDTHQNCAKPQLMTHETAARMPPEMPLLHYQSSVHQHRTMPIPTSYHENKQLAHDSLHRINSNEQFGNMSQHQHSAYAKPGSHAPWINNYMRERHLSQEQFPSHPWKHWEPEPQQRFHQQHYHSGLELERGMICVMCNKPANFLCSGCESEWYCSMSCQKNNWERHKAKCQSRQKGKSAIQSEHSIDNSQLMRRS